MKKNTVFDETIVCLGTYSGVLLGYKLIPHKHLDCIDAQLVFSNAAHNGIIKTISTARSLVITGGTDEHLKVFDLSVKREKGVLTAHTASITAIDVVTEDNQPTLLVTGAQDGTLIVWGGNSRKWIKLMQLPTKKFNAPILSISIHHSKQLALSVSTVPKPHVHMWDFKNCTCVYDKQLDIAPVETRWCPQSDLFVIVFPKNVLLSMPNKLQEVEFLLIQEEKLLKIEQNTAVIFLNSKILLIATSIGNIFCYQVELDENIKFSVKELWKLNVKKEEVVRIKSMVSIKALWWNKRNYWFVVAGSNGEFSVWFWNYDLKEVFPQQYVQIDTGAHVTCMNVSEFR